MERIFLSIISCFIAARMSLSIVNFFSNPFLHFDMVGGLFTLGEVGFDSGDFDFGFFESGDDDFTFSFSAAFLAALATLFYAVSLGWSYLRDTFGDCVVISFTPIVSGSESL